jgi:acyl carrier protein
VERELIYDSPDVTLTVEDNLLLSGLLDSLKILQLVQFIEKRFAIQIPQSDVTITKFGSISAIVDYLKQRQGT